MTNDSASSYNDGFTKFALLLCCKRLGLPTAMYDVQ